MTGAGSPRHVVAAPDKFKGTLTARAAADAIASGARRAGLVAIERPLADGGDGSLEAIGGSARTTVVTGPLGDRVEAEWRLLDDAGDGPVAVVEMAAAAGLVLAGGRAANDPVRATTRGVGELILAGIAAGARRILVGCGGSATTDGGSGALEVLAPSDLVGHELLVACDVTTTFLDAARVFGPQKGADPATVDELGHRLERLAAQYRERFGIDVTTLERSGAAGGLAGGLAAIGGRLVSGFDVIADLVGLDGALKGAALVVTGEGRLDATSLAGKVVGGVIERVAGRVGVLVVAGSVEEGFAPPPGVVVTSLSERFGAEAAFARPAELVADVVAEATSRLATGTTP